MASTTTAWLALEPFYQASGDECARFTAAFTATHAQRLPVLLKGPSGCGKTRFVHHMARRLKRPLITVVCNDDMSANDLTGCWLLDAQGMRWQDDPLTTAARTGAICYLDELTEARPDTTVVMHPLTDTHHMLPLDAHSQEVHTHPEFALVGSYNLRHAAFRLVHPLGSSPAPRHRRLGQAPQGAAHLAAVVRR